MRITHQGLTTLPVLHDRGGAIERRIVELAAAQVAAGHDVRILSPDSANSVTKHRGIIVQGIRLRSRRPVRDYEMLLASRRYLRADPPDVLHFHGEREGARFNAFLDAPTVLSVDYFRYRGSTSRLGHKYYEKSLRQFDCILPVSKSCAQEFERFWGSPAPIEVLYNGVNVNQFHPDPESGQRLRAELGLEGLTVLYVGRLCEQKGTDVLLDAWENCRVMNATLIMAGPIGQFGTDRKSEYLNRMSSLGVRYLGAVEERRLADIYNACDVFVMPTVRDEMFGMAALEAQACGKPVIASYLGGLVEAVSADGGIFFEPGNSLELGAALITMLDDEVLRLRMGLEARNHSLAFSWNRITDKAQSIYESIVL